MSVQDPLNVVRQRDVEGICTSVLESSYMCSYGGCRSPVGFTLLDDTMPRSQIGSRGEGFAWARY